MATIGNSFLGLVDHYKRTDRNLHWHLLIAAVVFGVGMYFIVRAWG